MAVMSVGLKTRLLFASAVAALIAVACVGDGDGDSASGDASEDGLTFDDLGLDDRVPLYTESWNTDWTKRTISLSELIAGIQQPDPRDVIQPIDDPQFDTVGDAAQWLVDREPVVALELEGEARAYPLRILTSHEVVNDVVGDRSVVVSYCPLCNSAVTFDRELDGQVLRFGVSGLLRNSDLVMWDRQTESLWQQIGGEAIVGSMVGATLDLLPAPVVTWAQFKANFPDGLVLSQDTEFARRRGDSPYVDYDDIVYDLGVSGLY